MVEISRSSGRSARGMTLLEVMLSCAVLSLAITGTFSAWTTAERLNIISREEAIIQLKINQVMSEIRALPYDQIPNDINNTAKPGFSGGLFDPSNATNYRLKPAEIRAYLGTDSGLTQPTNEHLRGLRVESYPFEGSISMAGNRYVGPGTNIPEIRVILINTNNPIEAQIGSTPSKEDGVDLNMDGVINTGGFPAPALLEDTVLESFVEPLFPRVLSPNTDMMSTTYFNIKEMLILPVLIEARWWSAAGVPREIHVLTFITNRGVEK